MPDCLEAARNETTPSGLALDHRPVDALIPYPTDLTDAQWAAIEPMIPDARPGGRPRKAGIRVAEALITVAAIATLVRRR